MKNVKCDDFLTFGRYYSHKIIDVLTYDASYILWMLINHKTQYYISDLEMTLKTIFLKSVHDNIVENTFSKKDEELLLQWEKDNKKSHEFIRLSFKQGKTNNVYFGKEFEKIGVNLKDYNDMYSAKLIEANNKNIDSK